VDITIYRKEVKGGGLRPLLFQAEISRLLGGESAGGALKEIFVRK